MTRIAFVSFANGVYLEAQKRLVASVKRFRYDIFTYNTPESIGSPAHADSPYEFKLHAIRAVYMKGYDIVIWCDSVIQLLRPIGGWIPEIEKRGVYLQRDGHRLGNWATDTGLFKGKWHNRDRTESQDPRCEGHRHDQTCAELVARELGLQPGPRVMRIDSEATPDRYFTSRR